MGGRPAETHGTKAVILALLAVGCVSSGELQGQGRDSDDAADLAALRGDVMRLREQLEALEGRLARRLPAAPIESTDFDTKAAADSVFSSFFNCTNSHAEEANVTIGPFFCAQQNLGEAVTANLLPILTHWTVCLLAGTLLCWQFHFLHLRRVRSTGKAIVVLGLYYGDWTGQWASCPFVLSVWYIFLEEGLLFWIWSRIASEIRSRSGDGGRNDDGGDERVEEGPKFGLWAYIASKIGKPSGDGGRSDDGGKSDVAFNVYMDFRKSLITALWMFMAQAGLIMYFAVELNGGSDEDESPGRDAHDRAKFSLTKWFTALAIISNTGSEQNGAPFRMAFWCAQWHKLCQVPERCVWPFCLCDLKPRIASCSKDKLFLWSGASPARHVAVRAFLDITVNLCGRSMIRGLAPMMLAVEGPLDFVKDATAVFFAVALDDLAAGVNLSEPAAWEETAKTGSDEIEATEGNPNYKIDGLRQMLFPHSFSADDPRRMPDSDRGDGYRELQPETPEGAQQPQQGLSGATTPHSRRPPPPTEMSLIDA